MNLQPIKAIFWPKPEAQLEGEGKIMKGTIFIKDKKVTLFIGGAGQVPTVTIELTSPQFIFDGEKVTIVDGETATTKK